MDGIGDDAQPFNFSASPQHNRPDSRSLLGLHDEKSRHAPKKCRKSADLDSPNSVDTLQAKNGIGTIVDPGSSSLDAGSIQAGCSIKSIHDVISRFGDNKRRIVESIGFGGLLKFPPIKSTNRKFSAWLMGMVDIKNSRLSLPDGSTLRFSSGDVALVFGVPAYGKSVSEARQLDREEKEKMKLQCWPHTRKENQSIKAVEEVVDKTYTDPLTPEEEDAFKVAFVVFIMSTLFVPGAKHDYAHVDYWGALSKPSIIHEYNWAAYIHKRLLMAASKYKSDIETGSRTPIITGCYLFLQVFYLDNMDIPRWSIDHTERPRVSCFTYERIRSMIAADTHDRRAAKAPCVYGKSKVRPREQSCYTWAQSFFDRPMDAYSSSANSLWQSVLSLITLLRVPLEAAGPLYMAAAEVTRPGEESAPQTAIDCIAILLKIIEPFSEGFNYNFDLQQGHLELQSAVNDIPDILRHYCAGTDYSGATCACRCRKRSYGIGNGAGPSEDVGAMVMRSLADLGCAGNKASKGAGMTAQVGRLESLGGTSQHTIGGVDYAVVKIMARFYMLVRCARERNRLDLNTTSMDSVPSNLVHPDSVSLVAAQAKTPWDLGDTWLLNPLDTDELTDTSDSDLSTIPRIVDHNPKYIEVLPAAARDQRIGFLEMELDMYDAMMRCFKRSDDAVYIAEGRARWRHYFESDILSAVLAGWFDIGSPCIRNQFIGGHLGYDLYNCTMLFFPVIIHARWVCFSWNLKENKVVVFDPAGINVPWSSRRAMYKRVVELLASTLSAIIPNVIPGWEHDWRATSIQAFHWRYHRMPCSNRTGVLCAYFSRCFNGNQLEPLITQDQVEHVAEKLFAEVRSLGEGRSDQGTFQL